MEFRTPEDLLGEMKNKIPDPRKFLLPFAGVVLVLALLFTSIYSVGPDEAGVIRRFGRYVRTENPGLHFKLPFNLEKASKVKVTYVFKEEFGFRTLRPGVVTRYAAKEYFDESLMLTGDLNVLVVEWIVQFQVRDPKKVLFNLRDPRAALRNISEAVMRQVIGDYSVSDALTVSRVEINLEAQDKLQEILDSYDSGIQIGLVKLQDVNPPDKVKPSFNEVNEAKQEKEKVINQAWEAFNKVIPRARGEAEKTIKQAEGYALTRVNQAKGDALKFIAIWETYKDAKEVTRKRLFLETLNEVLPRAGAKYVVDSAQKGILPLLRLDKTGGEL